jgi:general secretion pathway protein N
MRIPLRTGPGVLFGLFLLVALVVFLPMRLAMGWLGLGEQGLTARRVSGTIWGATVSEARYGDLALGDLHASLAPLPLLLGRASVALEGPDRAGAQPLTGALSIGRSLTAVEDMTATLPTGDVFAPVPVSALDLEDVTVRFRDGRCDAAKGRVRATLGGQLGGVALPPTLAGNARCDRGALLLPLASTAGTEAVALRIEGDGRYRADLTLQPGDPLAGQRLEQSGFTPGPGGYRLSVEGRL